MFIDSWQTHFHGYLRKKVDVVVYGQNVAAGSRIGGICRGVEEITNVRTLNTTNSENTLAGFGFGLLLAEVDAVYVLKQHDFMLLGMDQWRNTWNVLKNRQLNNSYVVIAPVVDSGYEGPQANLNNLQEFSSIFGCPTIIVNSYSGIRKSFEMVATSGLTILGLSQKMLKSGYVEPHDLAGDSNHFSIYCSDYIEEKRLTRLLIIVGFATKEVLDTLSNLKSFSNSYTYFVVALHLLNNSDTHKEVHKSLSYVDIEDILIIDDSYSSINEASKLAREFSKIARGRCEIIQIDNTEHLGRPTDQEFQNLSSDIYKFFGVAVGS